MDGKIPFYFLQTGGGIDLILEEFIFNPRIKSENPGKSE